MNYVRYMLRDKELSLESEVPLRRFNFLYKICDFNIGLTPESQGQLARQSDNHLTCSMAVQIAVSLN